MKEFVDNLLQKVCLVGANDLKREIFDLYLISLEILTEKKWWCEGWVFLANYSEQKQRRK
jgi:hypothetical protein